MISMDDAAELAQGFLDQRHDLPGDKLVLLREHTIEKPYGWVFFYNSRHFVETGDIQHMVGGNAPLLVSRTSGKIVVLGGTARPVSEYLKPYDDDPAALG